MVPGRPAHVHERGSGTTRLAADLGSAARFATSPGPRASAQSFSLDASRIEHQETESIALEDPPAGAYRIGIHWASNDLTNPEVNTVTTITCRGARVAEIGTTLAQVREAREVGVLVVDETGGCTFAPSAIGTEVPP